MIRLAGLAMRRPKTSIAVWLVLVAAMGFAGSRITNKFSPSILVVKGTESSRAQDIATSRFGNSVLVPIMLKGPPAQLDRQGPALVEGAPRPRRRSHPVAVGQDAGHGGAAAEARRGDDRHRGRGV